MKCWLYYHKNLKCFFILLWDNSSYDKKDIFKVREVTIYPTENYYTKYRYAYVMNKRLIWINSYNDFVILMKIKKI